jgi:hypothetical protein
MEVAQVVHDGRLGALVLARHGRRRLGQGGLVGGQLSPVQFGELLADRGEREVEGGAGIVARLDGEFGQGQEQGVLVGRRELPLAEDALDLLQENGLGFGVGWGHRSDQ